MNSFEIAIVLREMLGNTKDILRGTRIHHILNGLTIDKNRH